MEENSRKTLTPNKHHLAIATYLCLLPLVYFVPPIVEKYIENRLGVIAISLSLIVPFMSYVLMPIVRSVLLLSKNLH